MPVLMQIRLKSPTTRGISRRTGQSRCEHGRMALVCHLFVAELPNPIHGIGMRVVESHAQLYLSTLLTD